MARCLGQYSKIHIVQNKKTLCLRGFLVSTVLARLRAAGIAEFGINICEASP